MGSAWTMRRRRTIGDDDGANAVEFALVLPVLVLLLIGIMQFGQAFSAYLAVTHAAREGARLASVDKFDSGVVATRAVPLTIAGGLVVSGPTVYADDGFGESVEVAVSYPFTLDVPLWGRMTLPLRSSARMRKE